MEAVGFGAGCILAGDWLDMLSGVVAWPLLLRVVWVLVWGCLNLCAVGFLGGCLCVGGGVAAFCYGVRFLFVFVLQL